MTKICRAEALVAPELECTAETIAAARLTGVLAAKKAWEIIPFAPSLRPLKTDVQITEGDGTVSLIISVEAEGGGEACALLAATAAALTMADLTKGVVQSVSPTDSAPATSPSAPYPRKPAVAPVRRTAKPAPSVLMGEVIAPRVAGAGSTARREAFRSFMLARHLRATDWAKKAGISSALIYAYLTGKSASIPAAALEKLAKVAKVSPDDLFKA